MPRSFDDLADGPYDLLVVGGGISGLFTAYDAAARGLRVLIVEADDWGSGLSFNHQRTLHGGLRALQSASFGSARRQIAERRTWAIIAPHLVRPLPFMIGTYRGSRRPRWAVGTGFRLYDWIARDRNQGVLPELHLPPARLERPATVARLFPDLARPGLTGGAVWHDYQTIHPDRLTGCVASAAGAAGARLLNHVSVKGPLRRGGRIVGADIQDVLTGRTVEIQASTTVLAAGAGLAALHEAYGISGAPPLLEAMNLVIDRRPYDIALAAPGRSGRMLTLVPWQGVPLAGTWQSLEVVAADAPLESTTVQAFVDDLNAAFPTLSLTMADVRLVHRGLVPAMVRAGRTDLLGASAVLSHDEQGASGVFSLVGTKYTTARAAAARAVDAVSRALGRQPGRSTTDRLPLPHAVVADALGRVVEACRRLSVELDPEVVEDLSSWYGTEAPAVLVHGAERGQLRRLGSSAVLEAEITYAAEYGQAERLADAVLRRTSLGATARPDREALDRAADLMAEARGWSAAQRAAEIARVENRYPSWSGNVEGVKHPGHPATQTP